MAPGDSVSLSQYHSRGGSSRRAAVEAPSVECPHKSAGSHLFIYRFYQPRSLSASRGKRIIKRYRPWTISYSSVNHPTFKRNKTFSSSSTFIEEGTSSF